MNYRPEIDGLRAVAVLPVIMFHAGFTWVSGGFVGVDIFFVISGYLITRILLSDMDLGRVSIARFYERRARRILPALFVVMLATLPMAWLWLLPDQMQDYSQSLIAVVYFVSNLQFWSEIGYFADQAELKPLLHTWSLAVEEQFYLLFPLVLFVLGRLSRPLLFWTLAGMAIASLALSEWGFGNNFEARFYLAPCRAWELLVGSLCAFRGERQDRNGALALVGLALVIFAILHFDAATPPAGFHMLVPVTGAALILLFAAPGTLVGQILSLRPCVGLGLISYSAYLWHQPLFAFARIRSLEEPKMSVMICLAFLALVLAWATWRWVERPFRSKGQPLLPARRDVLKASLVAGGVFIALGLAGQVSGGFKHRFDATALALLQTRQGDSSRCHNGLTAEAISQGEDCRIGAAAVVPTIAILGDSHAAALTDAVSDRLADTGLAAVTFTRSWCMPFRNFAILGARRDSCLAVIASATDQILARPEIKTVVLQAQWANSIEGRRWPEKVTHPYVYAPDGDQSHVEAAVALNPDHFRRAMVATLEELRAAGKRVIVILPVPEHERDVPDAAARAQSLGLPPDMFRLELERYMARNGLARTILQDVAAAFGATVIDPMPLYCDATECRTVDATGQALYSDGNHLSYAGGLPLAAALGDAILAPSGD